MKPFMVIAMCLGLILLTWIAFYIFVITGLMAKALGYV